MNLKRLPIKRMGDEVLAIDTDGKPYDITNPEDIPEGVKDGIFTLDTKWGTSRFESRQSVSDYKRVYKLEKPAEYTTLPMRVVRFGETVVYTYLDGAVNITLGKDEAIVDAPGLSPEMQTFLGALLLEGLNLSVPLVIGKALRYILKGE